MNPKLLAHNKMCSDNNINTKSFFLPQESFVYPFKLGDYLLRKLLGINNNAAAKILIQENPSDYPVSDVPISDTTIYRTYLPKNNPLYPPIYCYATLYSEDSEKDLRISAGRSYLNMEEAMQKAFGEYLERTSLKYTEQDKNNIKTFPKWILYNSKKSSFRIDDVPRPTSKQIIYNKFPKDDEALNGIKSCYALNTSKNRKELVPMQCAYYHSIGKGEVFLHPNTTNGGGGGTSLEMARLSAVYELIERDSFFLHWLSGIQASIIDIETISDNFKLYLKEIIKKYNIKIYVLDTTYDTNIFSCNVVIIDEARSKVSLGGSCGASVINCIKKAVIEAISGMHYAKNDNTMSEEFLKNYEPFSDKSIDKEKRMHMYNNAFGVKLFKETFLKGENLDYKELESKYAKTFKSKKAELKFVIETFQKLSLEKGDGYNLYFHEASGGIIDKYNYHVSRAYIPSFIKLWLYESTATPLSKRLEQFAKIHGKVIIDEIGINILPHPFP